MNNTKSSNSSILQILFLLLVAAGLIAWQHNFLFDFLFGDSSNLVGAVVNAVIVFLFALAIFSVLGKLLYLSRQQSASNKFSKNLQKDSDNPFINVGYDTLIGKRYQILEGLAEKKSPLPLGSLSQLLSSELASMLSFPKFIASILVLLGMLGTILSLGLALMSASDLLQNIQNIQGMGGVINAMSTALSTTMTAICCFILLRFSLGRLQDSYQNVARRIEHITAIYLVPKFSVSQSKPLPDELSDLMGELKGLVSGLNRAQESLIEAEKRIANQLGSSEDENKALLMGLKKIDRTLQSGFRIQED